MGLIHVVTRGVDKRKIFLDKQDHFRFIHDLFELNNEDLVNTTFYLFKANNDLSRTDLEKKKRKLLVSIHAFVLMPNHYHLLLTPRKFEDGISKFMHKLNMGYSQYFNKKYERKGTLFEGPYKAISVTDEAHFIHLPYYLHCNPLDLIGAGWREKAIKDYKKSLKFLESYRWSSHLDYLGKKNFPSVTQREFLLEFFGGEVGYKSQITQWLKDFDQDLIKDFSLDQ